MTRIPAGGARAASPVDEVGEVGEVGVGGRAPLAYGDPAGRLREVLSTVRDPEIRVLSLEELGILRSVAVLPDGVPVVTVTPTYTGCPAMDVIRADIRTAVLAAGYPEVRVETVWSPAWSTDWIGPAARAKLAAAGIAPPVARGAVPAAPGAAAPHGRRLLPLAVAVPPCPRCGAADTEEVTRFGSTACKALWRCRSCREPFDHLKEH
nr:1,2-phenylacetyl-CoA epoxidase subunit PaaD [Streptomyces sp. NBC_00223]